MVDICWCRNDGWLDAQGTMERHSPTTPRIKNLGWGPRAAKEVDINISVDCSKNGQSSVGDDNGRCCQDVAIKRYLSKAALKAFCDQEGQQKNFRTLAFGTLVAIEKRIGKLIGKKRSMHTNWH